MSANIQPFHLDLNWVSTSELGARKKVEVDAKATGELEIKLISQSALSHFVENLSKYIPFEGIRNRLAKWFSGSSQIVITYPTLTASQSRAVQEAIRDRNSPTEQNINTILSERDVKHIKTELQSLFNELLKPSGDSERSRAFLRSSTTTLDVDLLSRSKLIQTGEKQIIETSEERKRDDIDLEEEKLHVLQRLTIKDEEPTTLSTEPSASHTDVAEPPVIDKTREGEIEAASEQVEEEQEATDFGEFSLVENETEEQITLTEGQKHQDDKKDRSSDGIVEAEIESSEEEREPPGPSLEELQVQRWQTIKEEPITVPTDPTPQEPDFEQNPVLDKTGENEGEGALGQAAAEEQEGSLEEYIDDSSQYSPRSDTPPPPVENPSEISLSVEEIEAYLSQETPGISESSEALKTAEGSLHEKVPEQQKEKKISFEELNKEATLDGVAEKIFKRAKKECDIVKEAVTNYKREMLALQEKYPGTVFKNILNSIEKINTDLDELLKSHTVLWMWRKYPTPIAKLSVEQLIDFEMNVKTEAKRILEYLSKDRLGVRHFSKSMKSHQQTVDQAVAFVRELEYRLSTSQTDDPGAKELIKELRYRLNMLLTGENAAFNVLVRNAEMSPSLFPFTDKVDEARKLLENELLKAKHSLADENFLQDVRKNKDKPVEPKAIKLKFIGEVVAKLTDYEGGIEAELRGLDGNPALSQGLKDTIRGVIEQNQRALAVFKQITYPFLEGWLPIGNRWIPFGSQVVNKDLTEATGAQLLLFRIEALKAMDAARSRLQPYREAAVKVKEGRKVFEESLKAARSKIAESGTETPQIIEDLKKAVEELNYLEKQEPLDQPTHLLKRANAFGTGAGKLKALLMRVEEWEQLSSADRLERGKKGLRATDLGAVKSATASLAAESLKKIDSYRTIIDDPKIIERLSETARESLSAEIDKFKDTRPKAPSIETPAALVAYLKEMKIWELTAISSLEKRCHLCAFKNTLATYQKSVEMANNWSKEKPDFEGKIPLQLQNTLQRQERSIDDALRRVSGGNSLEQGVRKIEEAVAAIEKTQSLLDSLWVSARGQVKSYIEKLEAKKRMINEQQKPKLTEKFKKQLIKMIEGKIAVAKPYLVGLPGRMIASWGTPFDRMDEKTLRVYREDVEKLTTAGMEEVEKSTLADKVAEAQQLFEGTKKVTEKCIIELENVGNYFLAADLQVVLDAQVKAYEGASENLNSFSGLEFYCKAVGDAVAAINGTIEKIQLYIQIKPPAFSIQMTIIEKKWKDTFSSIPQYHRVRQKQLEYTSGLLAQCITFARQRAGETSGYVHKKWEDDAAKLEALKEKFTPSGILSNLMGLLVSQAIPVGQLNAAQMLEYVKAVVENHQKYFKK